MKVFESFSAFPEATHFYLYNRLFRFMCPMVLSWCPEQHKFSTLGASNPKYWLWYFNVFVIAGVVGFGNCLLAVACVDETGVAMTIMSFGLAAMSFLLWSSVAVLSFHAQNIANSFKSLAKLFQLFEKSCKIFPKNRLHSKLYWKIYHVLQISMQILLFIIAFVFTFFEIFAQIDPFYYTFPKYFPFLRNDFNTVLGWITFILRVVLTAICNGEACRFFAMYLGLIILHWIELISKSLELVGCAKTANNFIRMYSSLQVVNTSLLAPFNFLIGLLMGSGFIIFVVCNVASIKAYYVLPAQVYWFMPAVSILVAGFVYFFLTLVVEVCLVSQAMVQQRTKDSYGYPSKVTFECKVITRILRTLKPIEFSCGGFYCLEKGTEATFCYWVLYRTVDCCCLLSL